MALDAKTRKLLAKRYLEAAKKGEIENYVGVNDERSTGAGKEYTTAIHDGMVYHDYGNGKVRAMKVKDPEEYKQRQAFAQGGTDYGKEQRDYQTERGNVEKSREEALSAEGLTDEQKAQLESEYKGKLDTVDTNWKNEVGGHVSKHKVPKAEQGALAPAGGGNKPDTSETGGAEFPSPRTTLAQRRAAASKLSRGEKREMIAENPDMAARVKERFLKRARAGR